MSLSTGNVLDEQIAAATPQQLISLLYDGALKFLGEAKNYFAGNAGAEGLAKLQRVTAILHELDLSLDMSQGPLAQNLRELYEYMLARIDAVTSANDVAVIDEAASLITGLKEAWERSLAE